MAEDLCVETWTFVAEGLCVVILCVDKVNWDILDRMFVC